MEQDPSTEVPPVLPEVWNRRLLSIICATLKFASSGDPIRNAPLILLDLNGLGLPSVDPCTLGQVLSDTFMLVRIFTSYKIIHLDENTMFILLRDIIRLPASCFTFHTLFTFISAYCDVCNESLDQERSIVRLNFTDLPPLFCPFTHFEMFTTQLRNFIHIFRRDQFKVQCIRCDKFIIITITPATPITASTSISEPNPNN